MDANGKPPFTSLAAGVSSLATGDDGFITAQGRGHCRRRKWRTLLAFFLHGADAESFGSFMRAIVDAVQIADDGR